MQKYLKQIVDAFVGVIFSYDSLADILDDNSMQRLQFVRKLNTVEPMVGLYLVNFLLNPGFTEVIRENRIKLHQTVTDPLFDILFKITSIEINLREYNDSIKNNQFYL